MRNNLMKMWLSGLALAIAALVAPGSVWAEVVSLEDLPSPGSPMVISDPGVEWHGNDVFDDNPDYSHTATESSFTSNGVTFDNFQDHYMGSWGEYDYWDGWAYSNRCDTGSTGMTGQFTAMGSGVMGENGALGSAQYGIASVSASYSTINFDTNKTLGSAYFTNNAYAYHSMLDGDSFAKKFGGTTGNDADWFKLTITGKNAVGGATGQVEFYLADFRSANNEDDYIVDAWTPVGLSELGEVRSIEFALSSSDSGAWGMNTPAYFAMDNLAIVPEPSVIVLGLIGGLFAVAWQFRRLFWF